MYSRIFVAIDGSRTGDLALTEAVRLAQTQGAALRIAHVIDATELAMDVHTLSRAQLASARAKAGREILAEAAAFVEKAGLTVETRLLEIANPDQRVVDVLAEEAKAWPADLLVIGTQGQRGCSRPRLGSVADELARIAAEPVLLVRDAPSE